MAQTHTHSPQTLSCILQHTLAKFVLQFLHMLLCNLCIRHCTKKHLPGGRLEALATAPFGQSFLYCPFLIKRMAAETGIYCVCTKPHSFKNCPTLLCSFSAHVCSKEYQLVWVVYRENKALHKHTQNFSRMTHIMNSPDTFCDKASSFLVEVPPPAAAVGSIKQSIFGSKGCG